MDYFKQHNMLNSLIAIEKESSVSLYKYNKGVNFLRGLLISGKWDDAQGLILSMF